METKLIDRRVRRTRAAILKAFGGLVLERAYSRIQVRDILERAKVGRSTFYEHYRNKDDVLRQALSGLFSVLSESVASDTMATHLPVVIDHFWQNRRLARGLLNGSARDVVSRLLTDLVQEAITSRPGADQLVLPIRLVAAQIAGAQLALITEWLSSRPPCSAALVAVGLVDSAGAIETALRDQ